tara:strand:- start:766 stop:2268 length:1503 start_codon:yes stop_codon:yes gene_type:complete
MASNTIHTIYAPYRTARAVETAENADIITLESTGRTLFAAHPVPTPWLRANLSRQEQQDVLDHIAAIMPNRAAFPARFLQAVRTTRDRLESIGDEDVVEGVVVADRHSTYSTVPIPPFGNTTAPSSSRMPDQGLEDDVIDSLGHDFSHMTMHNTQNMPLPPPRSAQRHVRTTSCMGDFQGVGQRDLGTPNSLPSPQSPYHINVAPHINIESTLRPSVAPATRDQTASIDGTPRENATTFIPSTSTTRGPSPSRDTLTALDVELEEAGLLLCRHFQESDQLSYGGPEIVAARDYVARLRNGGRVVAESLWLARSMVEAARRAVGEALSRQAVQDTMNTDDRARRQTQVRSEQQERNRGHARREQEARDSVMAQELQDRLNGPDNNGRRLQEEQEAEQLRTTSQRLVSARQSCRNAEHNVLFAEREAQRERGSLLSAELDARRQSRWRREAERVAQLEHERAALEREYRVAVHDAIVYHPGRVRSFTGPYRPQPWSSLNRRR